VDIRERLREGFEVGCSQPRIAKAANEDHFIGFVWRTLEEHEPLFLVVQPQSALHVVLVCLFLVNLLQRHE